MVLLLICYLISILFGKTWWLLVGGIYFVCGVLIGWFVVMVMFACCLDAICRTWIVGVCLIALIVEFVDGDWFCVLVVVDLWLWFAFLYCVAVACWLMVVVLIDLFIYFLGVVGYERCLLFVWLLFCWLFALGCCLEVLLLFNSVVCFFILFSCGCLINLILDWFCLVV